MDDHFVTPVCVEGWTGDGPVDGHCRTGIAIYVCCDLVNLEPVFSRDAGVGGDVVVVGVYIVVAPAGPGVWSVPGAWGSSG